MAEGEEYFMVAELLVMPRVVVDREMIRSQLDAVINAHATESQRVAVFAAGGGVSEVPRHAGLEALAFTIKQQDGAQQLVLQGTSLPDQV